MTRRVEDFPLDPEVEAGLEVIDATLAGGWVDPQHAELAELALLLRDERPAIPWEVAAGLDERAERRFAPSSSRRRLTRQSGIQLGRAWLLAPAAGMVAVLAVAIVIVAGGGGGSSAGSINGPAGELPAPSHAGSKLPGKPAWNALSKAVHAAPTVQFAPNPGPQAATASLQPPSTGRKVTRGGQLQLSTSPKRIDQVAQEVFNVVGQEQGFVQSSNVTAGGGGGGYAQFQLSIPTSRLTQTMSSLSTLPHTQVRSRTDTTQDVTNTYQADRRRLADARALRASLVKQLAAATTQGEIDSLTTRIHSAEAAISSAEKTLGSLNHRLAYSQVFVTLTGGGHPVPVHHGGGFTLGRAAHDAGHVLTVAAGVALIALAGLLPAALLAALGWWIWARIRERRRRQALDVI